MGKHEREDLEEFQSYGLNLKVKLSRQRIRDWVNEYGVDNCYVRMKLSPESLVLLHLVKSYDENVKALFEDREDMRGITSWMASEDERGVGDWLLYGCNKYDSESPESNPMAFWTKEDVFEYIKQNTL